MTWAKKPQVQVTTTRFTVPLLGANLVPYKTITDHRDQNQSVNHIRHQAMGWKEKVNCSFQKEVMPE